MVFCFVLNLLPWLFFGCLIGGLLLASVFDLMFVCIVWFVCCCLYFGLFKFVCFL